MNDAAEIDHAFWQYCDGLIYQLIEDRWLAYRPGKIAKSILFVYGFGCGVLANMLEYWEQVATRRRMKGAG